MKSRDGLDQLRNRQPRRFKDRREVVEVARGRLARQRPDRSPELAQDGVLRLISRVSRRQGERERLVARRRPVHRLEGRDHGVDRSDGVVIASLVSCVEVRRASLTVACDNSVEHELIRLLGDDLEKIPVSTCEGRVRKRPRGSRKDHGQKDMKIKSMLVLYSWTNLAVN